MSIIKITCVLVLFLLVAQGNVISGYAQGTRPATGIKPFIMPVMGESGPSTWIVGQPYGNTTGAYVSGANQYSAGQFVHFGVDISMPCGTPLVAVADGVVGSVDNPYRGSAPHNLSLNFPDLDLSVLYGHLLARPALVEGQLVKQGEVVALSGDPDETCEGRPHLHLEVRSLSQAFAYNPIHFIDAPWHALVALGGRSRPLFQRDLTNPRRWMSLEDQPDVQFGGRQLNDYAYSWPSEVSRRVPENTLPDRPFTPVNRDWTLQQIRNDGCCAGAWWHPTRSDRLSVIDGGMGQVASILEIALDGEQLTTLVQSAPPPFTSADGTHQLIYEPDKTIIQRLEDGAVWHLPVANIYPTLSPDNRLLLWSLGDDYREIWVSALDGSFNQVVWSGQERNTTARWLDNDHVLISEREPSPGRYTTLSVITDPCIGN